jgi:hypothetical protein
LWSIIDRAGRSCTLADVCFGPNATKSAAPQRNDATTFIAETRTTGLWFSNPAARLENRPVPAGQHRLMRLAIDPVQIGIEYCL